MTFAQAYQSIQQSIPGPLHGGATGVSVFTIFAAYLDAIHGPVVTIGAILGAAWIAMQMVNMAISWVSKFRAKRKSK